MKRYSILTVLSISVIIFAMAFVEKGNEHLDKRLEIGLRNIGHQLLLHSKDSTSRVLPIKTLNKNTFRISFENRFTFTPDTLINLVQHQLAKSGMAGDYLVSVVDCKENETIFAYEINTSSGDLKPCRGREQQNGCYFIEIAFLVEKSFNYAWLLLAFIPLAFVGLYFASRSKGESIVQVLSEEKAQESLSGEAVSADCKHFGNFKFFQSKGILTLNGQSVELSANETKALIILVSQQNQIVERELLMKKIWEDEGVLVIARNVDVLISKLRKRLSVDPSVRIMTVHGKGYKLMC